MGAGYDMWQLYAPEGGGAGALDPETRQRMLAQAAALRGQQQLGTLASFTGDKVLAPYGQQLLESARQGAEQLAAVPEKRAVQRLRELQGRQQEVETTGAEAAQARAARPVGQAMQILMGKMAPVLTPGTMAGMTEADAEKLFPALSAYSAKEDAAKLRALSRQQMQAARDQLKPQQLEQDLQKFGEAVSTVRGRSNLNRQRQESLDRADRLSALILGPDGDIANLTPQQVREAASGLANLISTGGSSAVSQIDELTPQTLAGQWANIKQKVLNEPQGADAQAFLRNMLDTAARETKVIRGQIHAGQLQGIPAFAHLRKADPGRFDATLQAAGIDPATIDEKGLVRKGASSSPAATTPGGWTDADEKRLQELEAKARAGK